jgi:hypothetical protein
VYRRDDLIADERATTSPTPSPIARSTSPNPLIGRIAHHLNSRHFQPDDTRLSEEQIGFLIARAIDPQRRGSFLAADGVLYERTPTDTEIDFVGPELELPIESKYVNSGWRREVQTAEAATAMESWRRARCTTRPTMFARCQPASWPG